MPDDTFFLVVMSRWAIARAFLAALASSGSDKLVTFLQAAAVRIFRSTARIGPIDPEQRFISRLDLSLGFSGAETNSLSFQPSGREARTSLAFAADR